MTEFTFFSNICNGTLTDAEKEFAAARLEKMRARLENTRAAKAKHDAELWEQLSPFITVEPKTAATLIAEADLDVTPNKIAALLKTYIAAGEVEKTKVKKNGNSYVAYMVAAHS